jgi:DNA-binding transcriptional MerR regulator
MSALDNKRLSISEVSELLDLPVHILRQWEKQISHVRPKRDSANRRYYQASDIQIIKRIKHFVRVEKMMLEGAAKRLGQELAGEGVPQTNDEALDIIDTIEQKARRVLEILDQYDDK